MTKNTINDCCLIDIPTIKEARGNLAVIEKDCLPYEIKRVYYLFDVPSGAERGGHAHKELYETIIVISGSLDVILHDGTMEKLFKLNKPNQGLLIIPGIWRELKNFSSNSVCLAVVSEVYLEEDYIRDFEEFILFKNRIS